MKKKNISRKELAEILHVSPQYISEVANNRKNISLTTLDRFAKALKVPIAALLEGYSNSANIHDGIFICPHCGKSIKVCKNLGL